jgi:hypothetical protein
MPWSTDRIPKYRPSGQAVVTINSVTHYLGPHGTKVSKAEYDRVIAKWLASGRSTVYGSPERCLSVVEMLVGYLKHIAAYHGKGSKGEYPQAVRAVTPARELYGRSPAAEFGVLQFKAVRHDAADRVRGATPRTRQHETLTDCLRLPPNPSPGCAPRTPASRWPWHAPEQLSRLESELPTNLRSSGVAQLVGRPAVLARSSRHRQPPSTHICAVHPNEFKA